MPLTTALSENGRYDIVIEHPPVNAFTIGLLRELTEVLRSLPEQARVVVLRSEGRGFCGAATSRRCRRCLASRASSGTAGTRSR